jgi:NAD-dependent SIR2 family protein deacetylase
MGSVLSGAGISAENGLQTFRGANELWEGHRVEDVATHEAWAANPGLVLGFYKRYLCAKCRKRNPRPVKAPAPWYCPRCLAAMAEKEAAFPEG